MYVVHIIQQHNNFLGVPITRNIRSTAIKFIVLKILPKNLHKADNLKKKEEEEEY